MKNTQFLLVTLLLFFLQQANQSQAQSFKINLSAKHIAKIEKVKTAPQKLKKYHKYYTKDSARQMHKLSKRWQKKADSLTRAMVATEKLRHYREKMGIKEPIDTLAVLEQFADLLPKDSMAQSPLKKQASEQFEKEASSLMPDLKSSMVDLQNKYGLDESEAKQYLAGDSLAKKKMKEKVLATLNKEGVDKLPKEQQAQLQSLQSQWGISPVEAKQYIAGDSAAKKKMKVKALQLAKEKSLSSLPPGQRKQAEAYQKEYGAYSKEMKQYLFFLKDSVDRSDTLKSLATAKAEGFAENAISNNFMNNSELKKLNEFTKELESLKNSPAEYQKKLQQYNSKEALEKEAKDFVQKNPAMLKLVQEKMSLLMNKYSFIQNSNDLSTAIKRTSLKGKPVKERLVIATNFQVLNLQPVSIDFAPVVGYKFNSRFSAGVGGTYRQTFNDSIPKLSPTVWGYKTFVSYDVVKSFFVYGEYALNSPGVRTVEGVSKRIWDAAGLAGIGRKLSLHKNLDMTVVVLYNFLHHPKSRIYPEPFIFRIGFQLSDGALRRK
jgi:hypothetical protein